jgi:dTDP-4-dehydrorhamnose reductase
VEWVRQSHGTIDGYTNQQWSGATVLQLAKLIHWLIQKDGFEKIRKKTPVLHFAPMGPTTKAELVKQIALSLRLSHLKVRPVAGQTTVTRYLDSRYVNEIPQIIIGDKIAPALRELINFEKSKG